MSGTAEGQGAGESRRQHRDAWLKTLAIGAAFIVFANWVDLWPWLNTLALSALMVAFGVSIRETEVGSDSRGDSFYYLGLLFTFIALIAALIAFDWGSDATRTIGIIRNFGIALVTTIWGLAGRVYYAMSGDAPGDLEEALRVDLEDAVSAMKGSLHRAREQLDILVDTFEVSGRTMVTTVEQACGTAEKAAQTTERLDELANRIAGTAESLVGNVNAFHDAVESGEKAAHGLRESLDDTGERSATLGRELASAGANFRAFRLALAEAREAATPISQAIRESADGAVAVAAETASLRGTISALLGRAQEADSVVEQIGRHAQEVGGKVRSTLAEAGRQADQGSRNVQGFTAQASSVEEAFASMRESAVVAQDGISNVAGSARSLEEQVAAIDGRALSESVGSARRRGDELGSALSGLHDQSVKLSQFLTTASHEAEQLSEETREVRSKIRGRREAPRLLQRMRSVFVRRRNHSPENKPR